MATTLYDSDFAAWAFGQAEAVRRGDWRALDVPNLVEELESMGKQQRAELVNRLVVLLTHLLKLDTQSSDMQHHRSWRLSIAEQRKQVARHLAANPSLRPYLGEAMTDAFDLARLIAARETGIVLSKFPASSPYAFDDAMNRPLDAE